MFIVSSSDVFLEMITLSNVNILSEIVSIVYGCQNYECLFLFLLM